jgi:putative peptidoglycan lipid II flippase
VRYGIIAMLTNMVFNAIFAYLYGYIGLALATALSALVNASLLYRGLHRANVYRVSKTTLLFVLRLVFAGAVMVAALLWLLPAMSQWLAWSLSYRVLWLAGLIALGAAAYLVTVLVLGVRLHHLKAEG